MTALSLRHIHKKYDKNVIVADLTGDSIRRIYRSCGPLRVREIDAAAHDRGIRGARQWHADDGQ